MMFTRYHLKFLMKIARDGRKIKKVKGMKETSGKEKERR